MAGVTRSVLNGLKGRKLDGNTLHDAAVWAAPGGSFASTMLAYDFVGCR
jgi:hypothetical protein